MGTTYNGYYTESASRCAFCGYNRNGICMSVGGIKPCQSIKISSSTDDMETTTINTKTTHAKLDNMPLISTDFKMTEEEKNAFCVVCEDCGDNGIVYSGKKYGVAAYNPYTLESEGE